MLGVLVHNNNYNWLIYNIQDVIKRYPNVIDPRTGIPIHFPSGIFKRVGRPANLTAVLSATERRAFEREWLARGLPLPDAGYAIHHIHPVEWGGDKSFFNLIPLSANEHQLYSDFWTWIRFNQNPFGS